MRPTPMFQRLTFIPSRRLFVVALTAACVWANAAFGSEPKSVEPPTYVVGRAKSAPIVDGVADDPAWENVKMGRLQWETRSGAAWTNVIDLDVAFRAVWRDGTLYVALKIEDDHPLVDTATPERSDRLVLFIVSYFDEPGRRYTIPIHESASLENDNIPFAAWSSDGSLCEFSLETESMYSASKQLQINLFFVDADPNQSEVSIAWLPNENGSMEPQPGTFRFENQVTPDSNRVTTWGQMKSLY